MFPILKLLWHKDPTLLALTALDLWAILYGLDWLVRLLVRRWREYDLRQWLRPIVLKGLSGSAEPTWADKTSDGDLVWTRVKSFDVDNLPEDICPECLGERDKLASDHGDVWHCTACGGIADAK